MTARGIRNHNPGNLRRTATKWQGLASPQADPEFFQFQSPVWGIRALARTLITYRDKYECTTPTEIISRYAPATENNTSQYVLDICQRTGLQPMQHVDVHEYKDCRALVTTIITHENGVQPYSAAQIDEGLKLAGVVQPSAPSKVAAVATDPKVIATTIAATAASAQATISSVADIWDTLGKYIDPRILVWSCVAVVVIAAGVYVAQRLRARKDGLA